MDALKRLFANRNETSQQDSGSSQPKANLGTCVGESKACPEGGRLHAKIEGRYVTILRIDGTLSCIDSICFHAGGPLGIGDIEDVNGRKCLVCPWHFYKIDIQSGDKYYQGMEFKDGKLVGGEWKSNGVRQRVHTVIEDGGKIYVTLSTKAPVVDPAGNTAAGICGGGGGLTGCAPGNGAAESPGNAAAAAAAAAAMPAHVDSDGYAFDTTCGDRMLNAPPSAIKNRLHSVGADGRKPSGQVLRGQYQS